MIYVNLRLVLTFSEVDHWYLVSRNFLWKNAEVTLHRIQTKYLLDRINDFWNYEALQKLKIHLFYLGLLLINYLPLLHFQIHHNWHWQLVQDPGAAARGPQEADGDAAEGHCQHEAAEDDIVCVNHCLQTKPAGPFRWLYLHKSTEIKHWWFHLLRPKKERWLGLKYTYWALKLCILCFSARIPFCHWKIPSPQATTATGGGRGQPRGEWPAPP